MITSLMALADGDQLINAVIWLVGIGLIAWLLWWLVDYTKPPEPMAKVARVLIAIVVVVMLIRIIIRITGTSF